MKFRHKLDITVSLLQKDVKMLSMYDLKQEYSIDEDSFETYLMYEKYENGFYWMEDRAFFMLEITGGIFYYAEPTDLLNFYGKLKTVLRSIPAEADASFQSIFMPYRDILFEPPKATTNNPLIQQVYAQVIDKIEKGPTEGYFDTTSKLREMRNFLVIIFPIQDNSTLDKIEDALDQRSKRVGSCIDETFNLWKTAFTTALSSLGADFEDVKPEKFLYMMFTLLNQDFDPLQLKYLHDVPLRRQLLYNLIRTDYHEVAYANSRWALGYVENFERVKPGFLVELMTMRRPFFISVTLHPESSMALQTTLRARKQSAFNRDLQAEYAEEALVAAKHDAFSAEIYIGFLVSTYQETELVKSEIAEFLATYRWTFHFETVIAPDLLRSSLPAHFNTKASHRVFLYYDHALCFLNFRNFRSNFSSRGIILVSEDFSPRLVDVFDSQAYGTLISGGSGSGKTFFSQYIILMSLAQGQRVFVIDPKGDYEALCTVLDGIYTKIGLDSGCSGINCFPEMSREELHSSSSKYIIAMALAFLERLLSIGSDTSVVTALGRSLLQRALFVVYENTDKPDLVTFHDVLTSIYTDSGSELAKEYAAALELFLPSGTYGCLISTAPTVLSPELTVFDLGPIKETPELLQLVIFGLMTKISALVSSATSARKALFIDEAHYLVQDPISVGFIKTAVRVWRSLNGAVYLITQQLTDMLENKDVGKGIFQTLNNFFLLRQSASSISLGQEYVGYNDVERDALLGLHTRQGKYSFLAYYSRAMASDGEPSFGRFYFCAPRSVYWLITSLPAERDRRNIKHQKFLEQGFSTIEAMSHAIAEILKEEAEEQEVALLTEQKATFGDDLRVSPDVDDDDNTLSDTSVATD